MLLPQNCFKETNKIRADGEFVSCENMITQEQSL